MLCTHGFFLFSQGLKYGEVFINYHNQRRIARGFTLIQGYSISASVLALLHASPLDFSHREKSRLKFMLALRADGLWIKPFFIIMSRLP